MNVVQTQATARVAWRSARRNMSRTVLITSMIALPVMVVVAVAATARTAVSTPAEVAAWEAVSLVAGALALFATGLIAGAAIVVGTRRQLRELGLVGAIGGERRHVLAVVILGGATLGIVGSALGAALGIGAAFLAHPFMDELVGHPVGPVELNPLAVIGAMAMGIVAATLAALVPARAVAKLSTLDALSGRTPAPRPPGRIAGLGLLVVLGGGVLTVIGTQMPDAIFSVVIAGGFIAMLSGFLLSIPLLVTSLGRIAPRLPVAARLATRDAARHGRRTGAAVAAAVIALSVPVATATYSLSREAFERQAVTREYGNPSRYKVMRTTTTAASVPVALSILAVAVSLVASESRRSRQILVAVGASSSSLRKLLATTSGLLAFVAGVLAVPAGLAPIVALWASQDPGPSRLPLVLPWATIAIIVFLVPLVAAGVTAAVARPPRVGSLLRPAT